MRHFFLLLLVTFFSLQAVENRAYVSSAISNTVTVIDTTDNSVVTTIGGFAGPRKLSATPDGKQVYVANLSAGNILVIDADTNTISDTILPFGPFAGPTDVCVLPNGTKAYSMNLGNDTISVIDTSTNTISSTISLTAPLLCLPSSDSSILYVVTAFGDFVEIDTSSESIINTNVLGFSPSSLDISSDDTTAYISSGSSTNLGIVTISPFSVATVNVTSGSDGVSVTNDDAFVYVNNLTGGTIRVVDTSSNTVVDTVTASGSLSNSAASPDGKFIYVCGTSSSSVQVVEISSNTVVESIPVNQPQFITFGPTTTTPDIPTEQVRAEAKSDNAFTQIDIFNRITWGMPSTITPIAFRVYRDAAFQDLVGEVDGNTFSLEDHNRASRTRYNYYVAAVESGGTEILIGQTTVKSE